MNPPSVFLSVSEEKARKPSDAGVKYTDPNKHIMATSLRVYEIHALQINEFDTMTVFNKNLNSEGN